mgnify:FL=1
MANPHPEPHPENLRPIPKGTTEIQRKGGKASAKANAKRRTMREWAEFYANLPLRKDGKVKDPKAAEDIRDTNLTMEGAVLAAMYNKAIKGDVRAAEFLAKLKGQTSEDVTVHIDAMQNMETDELLALYEKTKRPKE